MCSVTDATTVSHSTDSKIWNTLLVYYKPLVLKIIFMTHIFPFLVILLIFPVEFLDKIAIHFNHLIMSYNSDSPNERHSSFSKTVITM